MKNICHALDKLSVGNSEKKICLDVSIVEATAEDAPASKIFLSPSLMKRIKLSCFSYLKSKEGAFFQCWPDVAIEKESIGIVRCGNQNDFPVSSLIKAAVGKNQSFDVAVEQELEDVEKVRLNLRPNKYKQGDAQIRCKIHLKEFKYLTQKQYFCIPNAVLGDLEFLIDFSSDQDACFRKQGASTVYVFLRPPAAENEKIFIGGLSKQLAEALGFIRLAERHYLLFSSLPQLPPPKAILLCGPLGAGKTTLAKKIAEELHFSFIGVEAGVEEEQLRDAFFAAGQSAPCILFLSNIDDICPKREESAGWREQRQLAVFLELLDEAAEGIFIVAASGKPHLLDATLRRVGRLDKEIEISIPNGEARFEILCGMLQQSEIQLEASQIKRIADAAHGHVGADLVLLLREALCLAAAKKEQLSLGHFFEAFPSVRPSSMREIISVQVPHVAWSDIGGQESTKQRLRESVEWPLRYPEAFARMGISPPKGILLYGPPGCSKTLMAKAVATEAGLNFIAVKGPELFNKWVGESEKAVALLFRRARAAAPSIIFFDEIDAVGGKRSDSGVQDRVLSMLLNEMDGIEALTGVTIIAATNRPDVMDPALLRAGRFDRLVYVGLPDWEARVEILRIATKKIPFEDCVEIEEIATLTDGYSGAEIVAICQEAAIAALNSDIFSLSVSKQHLLASIGQVRRGTTPEMLKYYADYQARK